MSNESSINMNDEVVTLLADAVAQRINERGVGVKEFLSESLDNADLISSIDTTMGMGKVNEVDSDVSSRYDLYDNMGKDSVISAALEMYADDALTEHSNGSLFSVAQRVSDSDNTEVVSQAENFLHLLEIDKKMWEIYYQLAKYGECYLELFYTRNKVGRIDGQAQKTSEVVEVINLENFCEIVDRPDKVVDVIYRGSTLFYSLVKGRDESNTYSYNSDDNAIMPAHKYIHFTLGVEDSKRKSIVDIHLKGKQEESTFNPIYKSEFDKDPLDKERTIHGRVLRGRSILYDIEKAYKNLSIMENVVMIGKLSRSTVTRVANVEVGNMSKADTRKAIQRVKSRLKNKVSINEDTGSANYVDVTGLDNTIINPISNGKGAVDVQTITTDPDIKSVADLEYFSNKLFGGLKIPKAYLGFESDLNDNGGDTLAQLSVRYSRTIRKIQSSVERGLENLCYLYLKSTGTSENVARNIRVNIAPPMTKEEQEKLEVLSTKLETINAIVDMLPEDENLKEQARVILLQDVGNAALTNLILASQKSNESSLEE